MPGRPQVHSVLLFTLFILGVFARAAADDRPLRIAFLDRSVPGPPTVQNAAALDFAAAQGSVVRVRAVAEGGWQDTEGRWTAPEESDVVWFHQADDPAA